MAQATSSEKSYASQVGTKRTLPNGDVESTARHPNSQDHVIRVRIRNGKIMEGVVHHEPIQATVLRAKKEAGEAKAKADRSAAARAAQKAKKQARSAASSNKQGNKTTR